MTGGRLSVALWWAGINTQAESPEGGWRNAASIFPSLCNSATILTYYAQMLSTEDTALIDGGMEEVNALLHVKPEVMMRPAINPTGSHKSNQTLSIWDNCYVDWLGWWRCISWQHLRSCQDGAH